MAKSILEFVNTDEEKPKRKVSTIERRSDLIGKEIEVMYKNKTSIKGYVVGHVRGVTILENAAVIEHDGTTKEIGNAALIISEITKIRYKEKEGK